MLKADKIDRKAKVWAAQPMNIYVTKQNSIWEKWIYKQKAE